jgi:hypothetical protein
MCDISSWPRLWNPNCGSTAGEAERNPRPTTVITASLKLYGLSNFEIEMVCSKKNPHAVVNPFKASKRFHDSYLA